VVASLVAAALASPSVRAAAGAEHWRELYVAAPLSADLLLEGYIDLAYRTDDGLVVVDYKTDAFADEADLAAKVDRYRLQGAAYAFALQRATGLTVSRMVFCFLGHDGAVERDILDLDAATGEVEVRAEAEAGRTVGVAR
jgi:ATP-dependent helicase/nuclease subunit A